MTATYYWEPGHSTRIDRSFAFLYLSVPEFKEAFDRIIDDYKKKL